MQFLLDELPNLSKPLPRGLLGRRNNDDVVHVPSVELRSEEADAELIDFIEDDIREVLGADIPQGDALFSFRAGVDHFAKKAIKAEEVFVTLRVLRFVAS